MQLGESQIEKIADEDLSDVLKLLAEQWAWHKIGYADEGSREHIESRIQRKKLHFFHLWRNEEKLGIATLAVDDSYPYLNFLFFDEAWQMDPEEEESFFPILLLAQHYFNNTHLNNVFYYIGPEQAQIIDALEHLGFIYVNDEIAEAAKVNGDVLMQLRRIRFNQWVERLRRHGLAIQ